MRAAKHLLISFSVLALWNTAAAEPRLEVSQQLTQTMVTSGTALQGYLTLKNSGDAPLKIRGVEASCGCTTFRLEKRVLEPGELMNLPFEIDTRGKVGRIEKTIDLHTNDPNSPFTARIIFHSRSENSKEDLTILFTPPCASCHIDTAAGKIHAELFQAICLMCHPTRNFKIREPPVVLTLIIQQGIPALGMPGFSAYLTDQQIQSLVTFIHELPPAQPQAAQTHQGQP